MADVNGTCETDFDCVDNLICYPASVSWTGFERNVCLYSGAYVNPFTGEWNATTYCIIVLCTAQVVVGLLLFTVGFYDLCRTAYAFGRRVRLNAGTNTTLAATGAALFHILWQLALLGVALDQDNFDEYPADVENPEKVGRFSLTQRVFTFLCLVLIVFAALQISVLWVEIAQRARSLSTTTANSITQHRRGLLIFAVIFTLTMLPVAALGLWQLSTPIAYLFYLLLIVIFATGRILMVRLLDEHLEIVANLQQKAAPVIAFGGKNETSANPMSSTRPSKKHRKGQGSSQSSAAERKTIEVIRVIQHTSMHVITGLFVLLIVGPVTFLLQFDGVMSEAGSREYMGPSLSVLVVFELIYSATLLYILFFIQKYAHRSSSKLVKNELGSQTHSTSNPEDGSFSSVEDGASFTHTQLQTATASSFAGSSFVDDDAFEVSNPPGPAPSPRIWV
ncbi:Hypothetical Protein FCC1311_024242 [Hondaea fermentalgiana]|uniref:Uncharacterized protein n=1 Tax=Hondaea fermentalgiana TaxID=2315210 RepID=A0A2R5GC94_9STRA|nr:Hypothetical Protein FCC1311_024242 [Hondaea fermentalgiana]|eukprot:GBG26203.1 Hypothetical Protein FCC1311_024242 [Hondaea fermentalgiana]